MTHAQTWDPVSGITVNRAVSSSRRTQAIFSRELSAATSSTRQLCQKWGAAQKACGGG